MNSDGLNWNPASWNHRWAPSALDPSRGGLHRLAGGEHGQEGIGGGRADLKAGYSELRVRAVAHGLRYSHGCGAQAEIERLP